MGTTLKRLISGGLEQEKGIVRGDDYQRLESS